jgi:hypothetical protein
MKSYTITCPLTRNTQATLETGQATYSETYLLDGVAIGSAKFLVTNSFSTSVDQSGNSYITSKNSEEYEGAVSRAGNETEEDEFVFEDSGASTGEIATFITFASFGGATTVNSYAVTIVAADNDPDDDETPPPTFEQSATTLSLISSTATSIAQTTRTTSANLFLTTVATTPQTKQSGTLIDGSIPSTIAVTFVGSTSGILQTTGFDITAGTTTESHQVWGSSNESVFTNRGTFGSATVVVPATNERVFEVVQTPESPTFLPNVATTRAPAEGNITILPQIVAEAGIVLNSAAQTSSEVTQVATTLQTTSVSAATINVAEIPNVNPPAILPPRIVSKNTTMVVGTTYNKIDQSTLYTGDHTATTSVVTTKTFLAIRGTRTYNATYTRHTTAQSTLPFLTSATSSSVNETVTDGSYYTTEQGGSFAFWQLTRNVNATGFGGISPQDEDHSVFISAMSPLSAVDQPALGVGAAGLTVNAPPAYPKGRQTAFAAIGFIGPNNVRGTWSYTADASSISVSANGGGISATTKSAGFSSSTSGAWQENGQPVTTVVRSSFVRNVGGVPPAGQAATVTRRAGVFGTTYEGQTGTFGVVDAFTFTQDPSAARSAFSPLFRVSDAGLAGGAKFFVTERNPQTLISESVLML